MADMVMSQITDDMRAWAIRLSREGGEYDRLARLAAAEERGIKKGWAEGSHTAKLEDARNFIRMGFPAEKVAQGTGLSLAEIQALR